MPYTISLLGTPLIAENGKRTRLTNSPKTIALICYLAVNGEQRREHVADMLYEATSTRQSLHRLRELLGRIRPNLPPLKTTRTLLSLDKSPHLTIDLWQLQAGLDSADLPALDNALKHYKRALLADFTLRGNPPFNDWLTIEREHLHRRVMVAYQHVCEQYHGRKQWQEGLVAAQRWLALDDLNEQAARWMIRFQLETNQQTAAQATAATLQQRLRTELDVAPEPASAELIATIQSQRSQQWDGQSLPAPQLLPSNSVVTFHRNADFVGREGALLKIGRMLTQESRPVILTGMGGVGKTQLAVEVAYRFGRFFDAVYWLNLTDRANAFDDAATIGGERGMQLFNDAEPLSQRDKVARVQRAWQELTPRLLIFDNCTDEELLLEWLPVTGGASVLVTSTRAAWSRALAVNLLPLDVLQRDESIQLLQNLAPRLTKEGADDIAATVGDLPLALQLAGGYLGRYGLVGSADYVAQLQSEIGLQHPSLNGRGTQLSATRHALNITHTFSVSYKQLQADDVIDQAARLLLACIACCQPAEALPVALAVRFLPDRDAQTAIDALSRLRELGLVSVKAQQHIVMHRLIAQFVQEQAGIALSAALAKVINAMCATLEQQKEVNSTIYPLPFSASHLQAVITLGLAHALPQAAILAGYWAHYLVVVAEVERIAPLTQQVIEAAYHETIDDHARVEALRSIAYALRQLGHAEQARQLIEAGLNSRIRSEGELHNETANSFSDLGIMALQDGEFDEAHRLLHKAVAISEQLPADERDDFTHGFALLHIGLSYISTGEFADGKPYVERAVTIYRDILPDPHAHRASANSMMGHILAGLNDHTLALDYFKLAVAQFSAVLGSDNFRTAIEQGNVAECLLGLNKIEEAQTWAMKSFAVINERYADTPQAAFAHYLLGKLAWRTGAREEAIAYLERSVALYGDEPRYGVEKVSAETLLAQVSFQQ